MGKTKSRPPDYYLEFIGDFNSQGCLEVKNRIEQAQCHLVGKIYLLIHSYGGYTYESLKLSHFLQELDTPVTTYNSGVVESAACTVYVGGENRIAHPSSRFFIHPSTSRWNGSFSEIELEERLAVLKNDREQLCRLFTSRTQLPNELIQSAFRERGYCINAVDAQKYGLAHEIRYLKVPPGSYREILDFTKKDENK